MQRTPYSSFAPLQLTDCLVVTVYFIRYSDQGVLIYCRMCNERNGNPGIYMLNITLNGRYAATDLGKRDLMHEC